MATKSEVSDDSDSVSTAPPSYGTIFTSASSADPIQCSRPSVFSFLRTKQEHASDTTVLSRVRDIVLAPDVAPSSVVPIANACAAALPAAKFSDILQKPNIEGHTALYWAIVNNRPEALSAFTGFISKFSSGCSSDLRLACMTTSNHALFTELNLGGDPDDDRWRRSLGCPPDEIQVHACDEPANQFVAVLRIRMFQKRLRTTQNMRFEFVAGGRIWWLCFYMEPKNGMWNAQIGLSKDSNPARPDTVLVIEAHRQKPGCKTPPKALRVSLELTKTKYRLMVPCKQVEATEGQPHMTGISNELGDWVMHDKTRYVDCEGTLHAKLEMTLLLFAILK